MVKRIFSWVILPAVILVLGWFTVKSVLEPVQFEKQKARREAVAIDRLKDIRTLQVAFKGEHNRYVSTIDSLIQFYKEGEVTVTMQIGSQDDSLAVMNTTKAKKEIVPALTRANKGKKPTDAQINEELYKRYQAGETNLVFSIRKPVKVKDYDQISFTANFCADSLAYIPFCGERVMMETITKKVSGVDVPLFEAKMPYKKFLKGLDKQLIINLIDDKVKNEKFPGLMVGSIDVPNNNAGNWE